MTTIIGKPRITDRAFFLDLELPQLLPKQVVLRGEEWLLKPEFHVTVCINRISSFLTETQRLDAVALFRRQIEKCVQGLEFKIMIEPVFWRLQKDYGHSEAQVRCSIIVMCFVQSIATFYNRLEVETGTGLFPLGDIPYHITLYTAPDEASRKGIGVYSFQDLVERGRKIPYSQLPLSIDVF
jgi:hypothetical protein